MTGTALPAIASHHTTTVAAADDTNGFTGTALPPHTPVTDNRPTSTYIYIVHYTSICVVLTTTIADAVL